MAKLSGGIGDARISAQYHLLPTRQFAAVVLNGTQSRIQLDQRLRRLDAERFDAGKTSSGLFYLGTVFSGIWRSRNWQNISTV